MCSWELNSRPFALLKQCSTTEPQEHNFSTIGGRGLELRTTALNRTFLGTHVDANIVMVILIANWPLYYIIFSHQPCLVSAKPVVSRLGTTPSNTSSFGLPYSPFKFAAAL